MNVVNKTCDFLIIGGGIVGINIARNLKKIYTKAQVILIEKEKDCGLHASGRNSGVLHAGFYYTPDSLKAKFTKSGNQKLTQYCEEKKIPINKCGKLVVVQNEEELRTMDILLQRGKVNGVVLDEINAQEAKKIEPRALTYKRAIFSPTTSSVDPKQVLSFMRKDAEKEGINIYCGTKYLKRKNNGDILTNNGNISPGFVINAAGLYADKIASDFNFSQNYRILPFKGIYLYSNESVHSFKTLIYPVPNLNNPFLGVHITINSEGKVKLGPTAIPAFWREQYGKLENFKLYELFEILYRQFGLLFNAQFNFRKLAFEEIKKYSKSHLVKLSTTLATELRKENYKQFGTPGIRAQLLNIKEKKLEMDFIIEGDNKSLHILNAVSPGFTSSIPFSEYVCEKIKTI